VCTFDVFLKIQFVFEIENFKTVLNYFIYNVVHILHSIYFVTFCYSVEYCVCNFVNYESFSISLLYIKCSLEILILIFFSNKDELLFLKLCLYFESQILIFTVQMNI
jgi:hypothetical protein